MNLGRLYSLVPDLPAAQEALQRALHEARSAKSTRGIADVTATMARVAVLAGDAAGGVKLLDEAAAQWAAWGERVAAARCLQGAARILMAMAPDEAGDRLRRGIELARAAEWVDGAAAMQETLQRLTDAD